MNKSKVLTYIPLKMLTKKFKDELFLSESAKKFLEDNYSGNQESIDCKYINYKAGTSIEVNEWAKSFGVEINTQGDYVIATILNTIMNWKKEASEQKIKVNGKFYKGATHYNINETQIPNLYEIPLYEEEFSFYVSDIKIPINLINENKKIEKKEYVDLTLPIINLKNEENLSSAFYGTYRSFNNNKDEIQDVKIITEFEMDLKGSKLKQIASLATISSSCTPFKPNKKVLINKPFYVYIKINQEIIFAVYLNLDSFLHL